MEDKLSHCTRIPDIDKAFDAIMALCRSPFLMDHSLINDDFQSLGLVARFSTFAVLGGYVSCFSLPSLVAREVTSPHLEDLFGFVVISHLTSV
jgi:hypothetical protein